MIQNIVSMGSFKGKSSVFLDCLVPVVLYKYYLLNIYCTYFN